MKSSSVIIFLKVVFKAVCVLPVARPILVACLSNKHTILMGTKLAMAGCLWLLDWDPFARNSV